MEIVCYHKQSLKKIQFKMFINSNFGTQMSKFFGFKTEQAVMKEVYGYI